jgi:hypothetical protein
MRSARSLARTCVSREANRTRATPLQSANDILARLVPWEAQRRSDQHGWRPLIAGCNAALQEREDAYRMRGVPVTFKMQYAELTALRGARIAPGSPARGRLSRGGGCRAASLGPGDAGVIPALQTPRNAGFSAVQAVVSLEAADVSAWRSSAQVRRPAGRRPRRLVKCGCVKVARSRRSGGPGSSRRQKSPENALWVHGVRVSSARRRECGAAEDAGRRARYAA